MTKSIVGITGILLFASNLHRRSIFLHESGAGLLGFAIHDSNKAE
jgi:hypothetical protein